MRRRALPVTNPTRPSHARAPVARWRPAAGPPLESSLPLPLELLRVGALVAAAVVAVLVALPTLADLAATAFR